MEHDPLGPESRRTPGLCFRSRLHDSATPAIADTKSLGPGEMTTDLIVLAFDNKRAAFEVKGRLVQLQKQHLIRLADAAVCVRRADGKLYIKQVSDLTAEGALGGGFWGLLAGILFWMPLLGMALGSLLGALRGSLIEYGISDEFIKDVARSIEPDQSALFLLVVEATTDRVVDQIRGWKPRVIRTNLSREQERRLRDHVSEANMETHLESHPTRRLDDRHATQPLPGEHGA